jgi:hypothetical protein
MNVDVPDPDASDNPTRASAGPDPQLDQTRKAPEGTLRTASPAGAGRRDYTSAVYGSVLAATVVVSVGDLREPAPLALLLLASGVVFWIAHVYAATVAGTHGGWRAGSIRAGMRHEWPVAFAAVPPAIAAAVCGLLPGISLTGGVWAALIVALGEQQLWGYAAVRNAGLTGRVLTRTMLLNVVMGLVIVALKFTVGH